MWDGGEDQVSVLGIKGRSSPKAAALTARFGRKFPCNLRSTVDLYTDKTAVQFDTSLVTGNRVEIAHIGVKHDLCEMPLQESSFEPWVPKTAPS